jgi:choline dehydrogenase
VSLQHHRCCWTHELIKNGSVNELNGGNNTGTKQETLTIDTEFHRSSSFDNYYMQAKGRSNFKVLPFSPVQHIILEKGASGVTATGVVYIDYASGQTLNATANIEVIMCAGSFQTPQLLMVSVS